MVSPSDCNRRVKYSAVCPPAHGAMAPSSSVISSSGTTSSGSTSLRTPMPVQTTHAPYGELKENDRGSRSSIASGWPLGHARFSEKPLIRFGSVSGRSTNSSSTRPSASLSAVSTESVRRCLDDALTLNRSMTTAMWCFSCFLSLGTSPSA